MEKYRLDVLFIYGGEEPNMVRDYMLGGRYDATHVIKKRGVPPVVIANPMERESAEKSGLQVYTNYDFGMADAQMKHKNDVQAILREVFQNMAAKLDLKGRIAFYGTADISRFAWLLVNVLPTLPHLELVTDFDIGNLFDAVYSTKDAQEIDALKEAGRLASAVAAATWDFIAAHRLADDGTVVDLDGNPLTIGEVKLFIQTLNFEKGLENADGMIFAAGREGATGHGEGERSHVLRAGDCIVFDYFPRVAETGYYHDMTRTWCIGYARPEVQRVYDEVMNAFNVISDSLKVGDNGSIYQNRVNDYFESLGHKTSRTHPGTPDGYFHSLGHGLGRNIHEGPHFRNFPDDNNLKPGSVFTIEPGLYYPDRDFGVRVEDTVYFDEKGVLHNLTDFKYDLVLPLEG